MGECSSPHLICKQRDVTIYTCALLATCSFLVHAFMDLLTLTHHHYFTQVNTFIELANLKPKHVSITWQSCSRMYIIYIQMLRVQMYFTDHFCIGDQLPERWTEDERHLWLS